MDTIYSRNNTGVFFERIRYQTSGHLEFVDITDAVDEVVKRSGVQFGMVNIQSKHTTCAVLINENEPLLLEDFKRLLERLVPADEEYGHNDFSIRTVNMNPFEDKNGHSHCRALFLPTSQMVNIIDSNIDLGTWQRIFLVELDKPKDRTISVVVLS